MPKSAGELDRDARGLRLPRHRLRTLYKLIDDGEIRANNTSRPAIWNTAAVDVLYVT